MTPWTVAHQGLFAEWRSEAGHLRTSLPLSTQTPRVFLFGPLQKSLRWWGSWLNAVRPFQQPLNSICTTLVRILGPGVNVFHPSSFAKSVEFIPKSLKIRLHFIRTGLFFFSPLLGKTHYFFSLSLNYITSISHKSIICDRSVLNKLLKENSIAEGRNRPEEWGCNV